MRAIPVYISWTSWIRFLDQFGGHSPLSLTTELITGMSVSAASQVMQAVRFLSLVDSDGRPSPELRLLIETPENRPVVMQQIVRVAYAEAFSADGSLDMSRFETVIAGLNLSPATAQKAINYLSRAASFSNITVRNQGNSSPVMEAEDTNSPVGGHRFRVTLRTGGHVEVEAKFNLFRITPDERKLIFGIVDLARNYEESRRALIEQEIEFGEDDQRVVETRGALDDVPF